MKMSFKLFLISLGLILLSFIMSAVWDQLELGDYKILMVVPLNIACLISFIGIFKAIKDFKTVRNAEVITALVGHIIFVLLFLTLLIWGISKALQNHPAFTG